ncbi:MAG: hypothetical protein KGJ13_02270 [Patescibacteria group bacterium]|nr:hypothetical protein [Patescibacteria group bacterium]
MSEGLNGEDRRLIVETHSTVAGMKTALEAAVLGLNRHDERLRDLEVGHGVLNGKVERAELDLDKLGAKVREGFSQLWAKIRSDEGKPFFAEQPNNWWTMPIQTWHAAAAIGGVGLTIAAIILHHLP